MKKLGIVALVFAGFILLGQSLTLIGEPFLYLALGSDGYDISAQLYVVAMVPALASLALGLALILKRRSLADRQSEARRGDRVRDLGQARRPAGLPLLVLARK